MTAPAGSGMIVGRGAFARPDMADQQNTSDAATGGETHRNKGQRIKGPGPIRDLIDGIAFAILIAVLMKWFAIEAYQIPTSSMQPTMMGCKEAQLFDRILVDKSAYLFREPQRWDIAVFRYPIRRTQNYVKRIAGLPGERLTIIGGNVYKVTGTDPRNPADLQPLPRPAGVQSGLWRQIFPARIEAHRRPKTAWRAGSGWNTGGEFGESFDVTLTKNRTATLDYLDDGMGGLVNHVSDGYPPEVSRLIHAAGNLSVSGAERVQDVRLGFDLTGQLDEWRIELNLRAPEAGSYQFSLLVEDGQGRLVAKHGQQTTESDPFPAPKLPARIRFTHLDDRLLAEVDGEQVAELDTGAYKIVEGMPTDTASAALRIALRGTGSATVENVEIERDQHYLPDRSDTIVEVEPDSYWMLGDNTQQSVDSRGWTAFTIGVDDQNRIVDPKTHPDARQMIGNLRPADLEGPPDADENPVPVLGTGKIAVTDDNGEVHTLFGEPAAGAPWMTADGFTLATADGKDLWVPATKPVPFVPRRHILGRPLLTFLRGYLPHGPIR